MILLLPRIGQLFGQFVLIPFSPCSHRKHGGNWSCILVIPSHNRYLTYIFKFIAYSMWTSFHFRMLVSLLRCVEEPMCILFVLVFTAWTWGRVEAECAGARYGLQQASIWSSASLWATKGFCSTQQITTRAVLCSHPGVLRISELEFHL